jgi:CHASE3 domain sensor protein
MSDPKDVPLLTEVVDSPTAPLSEAQLRDMESRIAQRVLEAIQPALAELLEPALGTLTAQVKAQAEAFVRAAVANALERELRQPRPPGG